MGTLGATAPFYIFLLAEAAVLKIGKGCLGFPIGHVREEWFDPLPKLLNDCVLAGASTPQMLRMRTTMWLCL